MRYRFCVNDYKPPVVNTGQRVCIPGCIFEWQVLCSTWVIQGHIYASLTNYKPSNVFKMCLSGRGSVLHARADNIATYSSIIHVDMLYIMSGQECGVANCTFQGIPVSPHLKNRSCIHHNTSWIVHITTKVYTSYHWFRIYHVQYEYIYTPDNSPSNVSETLIGPHQ